MKIHKVELLIVDHDGTGAEEIKSVIENAGYPNDCISPNVMSITTKEIEWSDDHPLNMLNKQKSEFRKLFEKCLICGRELSDPDSLDCGGDCLGCVKEYDNEEAQAKQIATEFYYWWHNQPGTNTEQGFDEWWKLVGS